MRNPSAPSETAAVVWRREGLASWERRAAGRQLLGFPEQGGKALRASAPTGEGRALGGQPGDLSEGAAGGSGCQEARRKAGDVAGHRRSWSTAQSSGLCVCRPGASRHSHHWHSAQTWPAPSGMGQTRCWVSSGTRCCKVASTCTLSRAQKIAPGLHFCLKEQFVQL